MDNQTLKKLVENGFTQRKIAKDQNCSQSTVKYWLKKYNLKTEGFKKQKCFCCKDCGDTNIKNAFSLNKENGLLHYSLCFVCQRKRNSKNWRKNKQIFVDYKGGKCEICGYKKCIAALQFHHLDPNQKDPDWNLFKNRLLENVKHELDKCQLLCSNCHSEIHFNEN
jgi:hypothetical protein